jgi:CheY-like chemotaxis protein
MAGGIAHDFNNFLTVIQGFSGLAMTMVPDSLPKLQSALERIETASSKAAHLTNQLLLFARKQVVKSQIFEVNKMILGIKPILEPLLGDEIHFQMDLDPVGGHIYMDSGQIEQVVVNLVVNARDVLDAGGSLTLVTQNVIVSAEESSRWMQIPSGEYMMIAVHDTGAGMEEAVRQHIFEPFFTTKEKGTGLGLAICHSIVQQSGGHIQVESTLGEGTTFKIYLPLSASPEDVKPAPDRVRPTAGTATILLVEDDDPVREVVEEVLSMHGYTVLACESGSLAIDLALDSTVTIDLLITDMSMPHMGGREVAERFTQLRQNIPILLVSGYVDQLPESLVRMPHVRFLPKPYTAIALIEAVQQSLDRQQPCSSALTTLTNPNRPDPVSSRPVAERL